MKPSSQILSYFSPLVCLSCHSVFPFGEEGNFCEACKAEIKYLGQNICRICGSDLYNPDISSSVCGECLKETPAFEWARSVLELSPSLLKILHPFKYSGDETALPWMAEELDLFLKKHFPELKFDFIVPVPLHFFRLIQRAYNQSLLLARALGKLRHEKVDFENLSKRKSTKAQSTLSRKERLKQLRSAFYLKDKACFRNKNILLVDDVYTTGATMQECAKIISEAGARVFGLSLARTPLITPPVPPLNLRGGEGRRI